MVLDAKAMGWAATSGIDTAKLKAAKVPIYGKWYFPTIPGGVPMVNLQTGERITFPEPVLAAEVLFAKASDLKRAGLGDISDEEARAAEAAELALVPRPFEPPRQVVPLMAVARPPAALELAPKNLPEPRTYEESLPALPVETAITPTEPIHMPAASVAPFVLAIGLCLIFLGLVTSVAFVVVGALWMLIGAIGWVRVNVIEHEHTSTSLAEAAH